MPDAPLDGPGRSHRLCIVVLVLVVAAGGLLAKGALSSDADAFQKSKGGFMIVKAADEATVWEKLKVDPYYTSGEVVRSTFSYNIRLLRLISAATHAVGYFVDRRNPYHARLAEGVKRIVFVERIVRLSTVYTVSAHERSQQLPMTYL